MTAQSYPSTRFRAIAIQTILSALILSQFSFAQDTAKIPSFGSLKGFKQTYYYSSGRQQRATDIARFIEGAVNYFQKKVDFTPVVSLYILVPQDWKSMAAQPLLETYGFPHNLDRNRLVVGADDNPFWSSFLPTVDKLPAPIAAQIATAYRKQDGSYSMMPFFDLLALHEMGHSYTVQAGLRMHRHWMSELFVNIMLHTYVAEKQPSLLPALEAFPNMVVGAGTAEYKFTSLGDFERLYPTLGMGPKNYGWYQCQLHSAAKDIYNAGGSKVLKKLWKALKKHQEQMTDAAFIEMLKKEVHPSVAAVYENWNRRD